jgi:hypothetical protein
MEPLSLTFSATADPTTARALRRLRSEDEHIRIAHGVSVDRRAFSQADGRTRHRARIDAVLARSRTGLIVSHASAAVLHNLPWFGPWPDRPTLLAPDRDHAQRLRFCDKAPALGRELRTCTTDGVEVTDLVSTAVDVALRFDRGHALVMLDDVLARGVTREELLAELDARATKRNAAKARRMIELADGASESVGESLGRLVMHDLRLPEPVLQHEFHDEAGWRARVDYWFPDHGVVVEFDGLVKYRDRALRNGRTAEEVVIDEKRREDRIRAVPEVRGLGRITWRDVLPGGMAPATLRRAGLPVPRGIDRTPAWR